MLKRVGGVGDRGESQKRKQTGFGQCEAIWKASDAAIKVICKGKVIKPKSIQWNVNQMKVQ